MKDGVQLTNNHDQFRIEQNNIDKAVQNDEMTKQFLLSCPSLYQSLVWSEFDKDVFNDTYLKLTYNYNPDKDFQEQFIYYFKMLKGWYYRSSKVIKYHIKELDENTELEDEEEIEQISNNNFEDLRNAILEQAQKNKA